MKSKYLNLLAGAGFAAFLLGPSPALAATAPPLNAASSFGALGGAGVTCTTPDPLFTGITVIGNVGSHLASTSVTGFPPTGTLCTLSGTVQGAPATNTAYADFLAAYNTLASNLPADGNVCPSTDPTHNLSGNIMDTATRPSLSPGVYCLSGVVTLTGQLTLNGPSGGIWIFKSADATTSITPINGSVVMAGGGQACNVYWQLSTTAVFDSNTDFVGNVLAGTAISFTGVGSSLVGRALAKTLVSMTGANISACTGGGTQPPSCKPGKNGKDGKDDKGGKSGKSGKSGEQNCDGDDDGHDQNDDDDGQDGGDNHQDGGDNHDHEGK